MIAFEKIHFVAIALPSFVCACGPTEPPGTQGALKEGGFVYCEDERTCGPEVTIPDHIAVGSTFTITFAPGSSSPSGVVLSSSDSTRLERTATNTFRALASGAVQVEARSSIGELVDFVSLDLGDIATLALRVCPRAFNSIPYQGAIFDASHCGGEPGGDASVEISQGSSLAPTVCAVPLDGDGNDLDGHLTYEWTIADGASAKLEMFIAVGARCATIGGLTQGNASVVGVTGPTSSVLDITVVP